MHNPKAWNPLTEKQRIEIVKQAETKGPSTQKVF